MAKSISRRLADSASPTGAIDGTLSTAAQTNITSVGTLSALAVTGALTVDTNTLVVDATNNRIGIGTSSPWETVSIPFDSKLSFGSSAYPLSISRSSSGALVTTIEDGYDVSNTRLDFKMRAGSANEVIPLSLSSSGATIITANTTSDWALSVVNGTNSNAFGLFVNAPSSSGIPLRIDGGGSERMRIDTSGNLLVGGTSLNAASSVGFTAAGQIRQVFASGVANDSIFGAISGVSNGFQIIQDTSNNQKYIFHNGGTPSVTIDASGHVGIGTASPDDMLDVENGNIRLRSNSDGNTGLFRMFDAAGTESGQIYPASGDLRIYSPNDVLFTQTGKVGIGTTSPGALLDIGGAGTGGVLRVKGNVNNQVNIAHSSNNSWGLLLTNSDSSSNSGYHNSTSGVNSSVAVVNVNNDALHLGTNNEPRMTISHTGNVGIGVLSPDKMLTINTGAAADGIRYAVSYSPVNSLARGGTTWHDGSAITGQIDTRYDGTTVDLHIGSLYSGGYNSLSRLVVKGNGNVSIVDGNLSFASGHGVDFSASANYSASSSELLDDYEEGLWYPYLGTEAQLGSPCSTNYSNKYVKIGRLVKCTGYFNQWNYANITSGTYMMIRNLPFPPEHHDIGMRMGYTSNIGNSNYAYGHTSLSGFYLMIGGTTGSGTHYLRSGAPTSGAAYAMITATYYTNS
jgi:hypothetical protein